MNTKQRIWTEDDYDNMKIGMIVRYMELALMKIISSYYLILTIY